MAHGKTIDIAIVGMSATFAGSPDLRSYWRNILEGKDCLSEAPDGWGDAYYDPQSTEVSRIYTKMGGFVDREAYFAPSEFGIMPNTVPSADPDHFLGLKLARDALVDAGYGAPDVNHERTGIVLGRATYPNRGYGTLIQHGQTVDQVLTLLKELNPDLDDELLSKIRSGLIASLPPLGPEMMPNMVPNVISGRIANRLNLMGPNYLIDAACASSLLAVEAAARELLAGTCDLMIAGGMHLIVSPQHYMLFSQLGGLSRSKLKPFGADADGTLLGEGIGLLVLKRLADAERDDDRIYAVLKGVGTSSDGRGVGLLAPRPEGQRLALRRAYETSGVDPSTVTLIEAHGTGMPLGDATEIATLKEIFGARNDNGPTHPIGSVKSMIGHCLPAAGAASLIKMALALHHKVLPPTVCTEVNGEIGIEQSSCYVNDTLRPWIHGAGHLRRAAVNSFGFGGINAHVILEEHAKATPALHSEWPAELLVLSAPGRDELAAAVGRLSAFVAARPDVALADLSSTLAGMSSGAVRLAMVAKDLAQLEKQLAAATKALTAAGPVRVSSRAGLYYGEKGSADRGKIAFLFPGEGGQHHDMLADLCIHMPAARRWFDMLDRALDGVSAATPSSVIFPPPTTLSEKDRKRATERLFGMEFASAAVFAASMAIFDVLTRLGVRCDMMLGHSTGEGAALVASGLIRHTDDASVEKGIRRFYEAHHDIISAGAVPRGALLTVGGVDPSITIGLVESFKGRIHLALDNCPNQAVLYGEPPEIEAIAAKLKDHGGICVPLPFDRGYHTPGSEGAGAIVRKVYDELEFAATKCALYSCASAGPFPANAAAARDLATRQIFSRVRFRETVERLYADGARTFIEVGPGGSLTGFVRDCLARVPHVAMPTGVGGRPALPQILNVAAQLFAQGAPIDLQALFDARPVKTIDLAEAVAPEIPKRPRIELDIPLMKLPQQTVDEVRARTRPGAKAALEAPQDNSSVYRSLDQREPAADPVAEAVKAHFGVMNEFLASQSRLFSMIDLAGAEEVAAGAAAAPSGLNAVKSRRAMLLGDEIRRDASGLVCERRLTIDDFSFVRDHQIGCPPSARDPNLLALPVIPFAVSMEIVAEAAAALVDGSHKVVQLTECRGYRWLAFDQGTLSLRITAKMEAAGVAHVRIFEMTTAEGKETQFLAFEGKAHFAESYPPAPAPQVFEDEAFLAPNYTKDMLYGAPRHRRYAPMFHGPKFQAVRGIRRWNSRRIEADLVALSTDNFCREDGAAPAFEVDPVLIDAASHLIAYWAGERFGVDLSSFPFAALDYRQYAPAPRSGETIRCRVTIDVRAPDGRPTAFEVLNNEGSVISRMPCAEATRYDDPPPYDFCRLDPADAILDANFEFLDQSGRVIATLTGWQDRYFTMPHRFYRCRLWPQTEYFSDPWMQEETGMVCRRVGGAENGFLEDAWGIWKRVLASLALSEPERRLWYALPAKGARRAEWLLGRIAAKDAVRQWAEQKYDIRLAPADVQILPDRLDRPYVVSQALSALGPVPQVSITHSNGRIVAAASEPDKPLGIDLVRRDSVRSPEHVGRSFSDSELKLAGGTANGVLTFWSAREAAAKALGEGLGGEPRDWIVDDFCKEDGAVTIRRGPAAYRVRVWEFDEELFAACRHVDVQARLAN